MIKAYEIEADWTEVEVLTPGGYNIILSDPEDEVSASESKDGTPSVKVANYMRLNVGSPNTKLYFKSGKKTSIILSDSFFFSNASGGGGGSGSGQLFTNLDPTPVTVGGVTQGTNFQGVSYVDMMTMIFYPYQKPTFTQFSTPKTNFVLGESTGTSIQFTWNTNNQKNIKAGSVNISVDGKTVGSSLAVQGTQSFNISELKLTSQGSKRFTIAMKDIKDSNITRTLDLTWLNAIFYGCNSSETIDEVGIKAMTRLNANSLGRNYQYPTGGYKYIAYPATWPDIASSKDPSTNFDVPLTKLVNVNVTNEHGVSQDYKVYRSHNLLNGSITITIK
ncbi:hypothetical protein C3I27_03340 [Campylobacter jejuni]|uniref:Uncharacterized protein n=1 Tax=Campylobacter jejuni TaxID=197 RepID=A0A430VBG3_CAMJU|nr:hypothetical protein [Campylobacter jejuni]RTI48460.1 hypothetical protein C3I27_03340 [Campylobacter jejuni]RTJ79567.1 hypothetical protein C3H57_04150 [Campylobacter jejuni]HEG8097796.1 hypothetical protein [Campylobacter jejuni]